MGSVSGAVELLLVAGIENGMADQLNVGRQDAGLIWLARSTVETWRERLAARVSPKLVEMWIGFPDDLAQSLPYADRKGSGALGVDDFGRSRVML